MSDRTFTTRRKARKLRFCQCGLSIDPGTYYLVHTAPPGHEATGSDRWERINECPECAERMGRSHLLNRVEP